ncbi:MAG: threonylcarbamoyl-AMP synthase [Deltaproteobacteria bacterium]|nr:threonylcarbamoyl-AMP synthase [Deltaproteobacteria bacterium]
MILKLDPNNPQPRHVNRITEALRDGKIIAYPTDTYYGIGCDLYQKKAIEKVYRIKKRGIKKPFSFICADLKDISQYARVSNYAYRTMRRLLPGPYTFILEGTKLVPKIMLSPRKEAGIRVPDSQICMALVKSLGNPIINTTASNADDIPMTDPQEIETLFKGSIEIVIEGGTVPGGPSTVVSLLEDTPIIIREGLGKLDSAW